MTKELTTKMNQKQMIGWAQSDVEVGKCLPYTYYFIGCMSPKLVATRVSELISQIKFIEEDNLQNKSESVRKYHRILLAKREKLWGVYRI